MEGNRAPTPPARQRWPTLPRFTSHPSNTQSGAPPLPALPKFYRKVAELGTDEERRSNTSRKRCTDVLANVAGPPGDTSFPAPRARRHQRYLQARAVNLNLIRQGKRLCFSSKARSTDHKFCQMSIRLVTTLNYKEAGRGRCPPSSLLRSPPSPGKQQQAEKVLNRSHFSSAKPFGVCTLFTTALLPGKGRALRSDEHHKMPPASQVLTEQN